MAQLPRIYDSDEELGKRDDNYRPAKKPGNHWTKGNNGIPLRWRRPRRIVAILAGAILVYLFVHNIPTDLGSIDQRMGRPLRPGHAVGGLQFGYSRSGSQDPGIPQTPLGAPPRPSKKERDAKALQQGALVEEEHYYYGPIKFYRLATSLHAIGRTQGHRVQNRNVLFAASSLKSAANLIPLALEMARIERNYVHFILLGREAVPMEDVLLMNGVDPVRTQIYFHDGRPDYSEYSTDVRAEVSVAGAMIHVNNFMHPQVVITDDSAVEDRFFTQAIQGKLKELDRPVIEVPKDKYEDFLWMAQLDSSSLSSWHTATVDVLIHVPRDSAGGLVRLLKSLSAADYAGLHPPRLTIELPPHMDDFLKDYIKDFNWPPERDGNNPRQSSLKLLHRIPSAKASTETNSVRFLESFYPSDLGNSHALILSTQTELSPLFYHYIMYNILEHRYSAGGNVEGDHLLGAALAAPSTHLNGSEPFRLPEMDDMRGEKYKSDDRSFKSAPFLWHAPSSDAAVIFGDKWAEMHDYLSKRLRMLHSGKSVPKRDKLISETQPGWMELLLELIRARGWTMLVPAQSDAGKWATVHNELYRIPEEHRSRPITQKASDDETQPPQSEEPFLRGDEKPLVTPHTETPVVQHTQPLHALLPFQGNLPDLHDLPVLSFDGEIADMDYLLESATAFSATLRATIGGCDSQDARRPRLYTAGSASDLFCLPREESRYADLAVADEDDEEIESDIVVADIPPTRMLAGHAAVDTEGGDGDRADDRAASDVDEGEVAEKSRVPVEQRERVAVEDEADT